MTEGKPIYVESLMTDEEWTQRYKDYPATSTVKYKIKFFNSEFKWRYKMGASMTETEITNHNKNLKLLRRFLKEQQEKELVNG